jgi:hypothetical protein
MDSSRLNNSVFIWACRQGGRKCKNWTFRVEQRVEKLGLDQVDIENQYVSRFVVVQSVTEAMKQSHVES